MDIPDPLLPLVSIVHRSRKVFQATSCIGTVQLYIGSSWSSHLCLSMCRDSQEYITYEFVLSSPAVSRMSGPFNFLVFFFSYCLSFLFFFLLFSFLNDNGLMYNVIASSISFFLFIFLSFFLWRVSFYFFFPNIHSFYFESKRNNSLFLL